MSLWGNNDNLTSSGTVSLNYATGVVTGSGTTFGHVGFGVTGDVIRFGTRGGGGTYFGDAVITDTTSHTSITIGSTAGLSGAAISGAQYKLSQLPKSTILDHHYSNKLDGAPEFVNIAFSPHLASDGATRTKFGSGSNTGAGASVLPINKNLFSAGGKVGDVFLANATTRIPVTGIGTGSISADGLSPVGFVTLFGRIPDGADVLGSEVTHVTNGVSTSLGTIAGLDQGAGLAFTAFTLSTPLTFPIKVGDDISFNTDFIVSIASTSPVGIDTGDSLTFQRLKGGYDKQVYGISTSAFDDVSTKYRTSGTGWVGVTTYVDAQGQFRVKSEILVAMGTPHEDSTSGIQTGTGSILYPTPV